MSQKTTMSTTSSLFILANLSQKIVHSKTGHHFLLFTSADDTCTIDLTLSSTQDSGEALPTRLLTKWWSATWSEDEMKEIGVNAALQLRALLYPHVAFFPHQPVEEIVQGIEQGVLQIRGWAKSKLDKTDLELKILVESEESRMMVPLRQCTEEEAAHRRAALLTKLTEKAQEHNFQLLPKVPTGAGVYETEGRAEIAQLTKTLLKRDKTIDDLNAQLEAINERLKEYIKDARPLRPTHSFPKIPANHGKASVMKKRRLVQQVEYEDP
ncbi:hypothetical protein FRB97_009506 [Tulasnella sp. 331]|nr:hypothetical protein FRB97_009506 [Tulasnella sp. 331]